MAVLVLDPAGANIALPCQKGGESAPTLIGEESPSFSGTMRNSVRGEKRVLQVVTSPVDTTTKANVVSLLANRAQVNMTGDLFGGSTVKCSAERTSVEMVVGGLFWVLSLTLREC